MSETTVVFFHLTNIPATEEGPFELHAENSVIFSTPEAIPNDAECVVEAEMPMPRVSEFHKIYVRAVFKSKNTDVVSQVNLTSNGYHILIRFGDQEDRVELKQSESGDFETGTTFSEELFDELAGSEQSSELQEGYTYNKPKLNVFSADQVESIMSTKDTYTTLYFHLANIPASAQEPFHVNMESKILVMLTQSQTLNKIETFEAKVLNPKIAEQLVVNLRIKISACDIDVKQAFNLTERGNHILIAMINDGENIKILQSKNDKFDLPWQKAQAPLQNSPAKNSSPAKPITSLKAVAPDTITFYLEGVDASFIKPFKIIINKKEFYKLTTPIPANQWSVVTCDVPRTSMDGDNVIDVQFMLLKQGWKDPVNEQFNVTQAGKYIKLRVFQEDDKTFNLDIMQQFGPFVPEQGVKTVTQEKKALDSFIKQAQQQEQPEPSKPVAGTQVKTTPSNLSQTASFAQTKTTTTVKEYEPQLVSSNTVTKTTSQPITAFLKKDNPAPQPAPAAEKKSSDLSGVLADIEKLASLMQKGILTPEEFAAKKKQLLGL